MENITDDSAASGDQKQRSAKEERLLTIQRTETCLFHAVQCKDIDCKSRQCLRMKTILQHMKRCNKHKMTNVECQLCKQLIALCCFHAKHCQEPAVCPIPFCVNIKNKMRTMQLRKRLQQAQILRRHITVMQNRRLSGGLLEPNPKNINSSSQPSLGAQPHSLSHSQSNTAMKPSSGPPIGALLAVQQVQAAAARQIAQAQIQNAVPQMMSSIPNYMLNMGNSKYVQNYQPRQNIQPFSNLQLSLQLPLETMGRSNSVFSSINSTMKPPQLMSNPGPSVDGMQRSTQDWQHLFQALRISSTKSSSINSTMEPPQLMSNPGPSVDDMQRSTQDWQQLFQTLRISSTNSPPPSSSYPEN